MKVSWKKYLGKALVSGVSDEGGGSLGGGSGGGSGGEASLEDDKAEGSGSMRDYPLTEDEPAEWRGDFGSDFGVGGGAGGYSSTASDVSDRPSGAGRPTATARGRYRRNWKHRKAGASQFSRVHQMAVANS